MSDIYIMRHGLTDLNIQKIMQGRTDIPLNETGRTQAEQVASLFQEKKISFQEVLSSPLSRAKETAMLASGFDEEDLRIDMRLIEMDFGPYEGTTFTLEDPYLKTMFREPANFEPAPGAESYQELLARSADFIEEIRFRHATREGEPILIVTHGAFMHAILCYVNNYPLANFWDTRIDNCGIHQLFLAKEEDFSKEIFVGYRRPSAGELG